MKDKSNFFSIFRFLEFILFSTLLIGVWNIFIEPFIVYKENLLSSKKDLSNSEASIKKKSGEIFKSNLNKAKLTSDQIFNSKLDEAKSNTTVGSEYPGESDLLLEDGILRFSARINYDAFKEKYYCSRVNSQIVDPLTKDIKIKTGECNEDVDSKCLGKEEIYDYIQYRANDEKNIRLYYPEIIIEGGETSTDKKYYYQVLPYSFFKDFQKISLRYTYPYTVHAEKYKSNKRKLETTGFDINSVLLINNFQKRCGIKKSIFYDRNRANAI